MKSKSVYFASALALLGGVVFRYSSFAATVGTDRIQSLFWFCVALVAVNVLSLGASEAFRLACARLTSIKKLAFSLILAIAMCFLGGGMLIAGLYFPDYIERIFDITRLEALYLPVSAAFFAGSRCFSIWFSARKQTAREVVSELLPIAGVIAALLIGRTTEARAMLLAAAMAAIFVILFLIALKDRVKPRPCGALFRGAGLGMLRLFTYPALAAGMIAASANAIGGETVFPLKSELFSGSFFPPAFLCAAIGAFVLADNRYYYRLTDNESENGVFGSAMLGTLSFGLMAIAGLAGLDESPAAACVSVYLLANAVWAMLYASPRRWYLAVLMLAACGSCTASAALGVANPALRIAPGFALFLLAALLSSRDLLRRRGF